MSQCPYVLFLLLFGCTLLSLVFCQEERNSQFEKGGSKLFVGRELTEQTIQPGENRYFQLDASQLEPFSSYEIKISYPAPYPVFWDIKIVPAPVSSSRRLMNVEKVMFSTDSQGQIIGYKLSTKNGDSEPHYTIQVSIRQEAPSTDPTRSLQRAIFNIMVDRVFFGAIPERTFGLISFLVLSLPFVALLVFPIVRVLKILTAEKKGD